MEMDVIKVDMGNRQSLASLSLIVAGLICLMESAFGCYAVLGIGFSSLRDIATDLSLTMAFPIYLLNLLSRRVATMCLWLFFIAQWLNSCLLGRPPQLISPLDGLHSVALLLGIVLVTFASLTSRSSPGQDHQFQR
jgi:hypothetical protein